MHSRMTAGVDLAVLDAVEAYALRGILEYEGVRVNWFPIATPRHLVNVLNGTESQSDHLVICSHGDERGIVVDELDPEVARTQPFTDRLTPELARRYVSLPGPVVVVSGCGTGSAEMASGFLDGGCAAYLAPDGYPAGALLFLHRLYHNLIRGATLDDAVERARSEDDDGRLFRLHRM